MGREGLITVLIDAFLVSWQFVDKRTLIMQFCCYEMVMCG